MYSVAWAVAYLYLEALSEPVTSNRLIVPRFLFVHTCHLLGLVTQVQIIMSINRRVKYYLHGEAQDGVYPDMPNQYETTEGVLIEFANSIKEIDGKPFQLTEAIIEDPETHEINHIDYRLVKQFVE